jgi:choline kinase
VVRSLMLADGWLREAPALIVYGDGVYGRNALRRVLQAPERDLLVPGDRLWHALWSRRFADPLQDAESWRSHGGLLEDVGRRAQSLDEVTAQFMGLLRLTPRGWETIRTHLAHFDEAVIDRLDMTGLLRRLLADGVRLPCIEVDGGWVEIDSLSDLRAVENALAEPGFTHDFR